MEKVQLSLDQVYDLAFEALRAQGFSEPQADAIAETILKAERDACESHGLFRVPFYVRALQNDFVNPCAKPKLTRLAPGILHLDAEFGFAPYALKIGIGPLAEIAREQGIGALCINNSFHIANLWPEAEALAAQGLAALAFANSLSSVAPAGGRTPLYGTNPMAFAWPREGRPPLVFDQASSVVARGEIQLHLRDGKSIPEGWAIGPDGKPTTDPAAGLRGALLTFGGHKGAAIALMVELLSGALTGDLFSYEAEARDADTGAPCGGEFLLAIDPARCIAPELRGSQISRAEQLFAKILEQEGTRLPSDRRYRAREQSLSAGIKIPKSLHETIVALIRNQVSQKTVV